MPKKASKYCSKKAPSKLITDLSPEIWSNHVFKFLNTFDAFRLITINRRIYKIWLRHHKFEPESNATHALVLKILTDFHTILTQKKASVQFVYFPVDNLILPDYENPVTFYEYVNLLKSLEKTQILAVMHFTMAVLNCLCLGENSKLKNVRIRLMQINYEIPKFYCSNCGYIPIKNEKICTCANKNLKNYPVDYRNFKQLQENLPWIPKHFLNINKVLQDGFLGQNCQIKKFEKFEVYGLKHYYHYDGQEVEVENKKQSKRSWRRVFPAVKNFKFAVDDLMFYSEHAETAELSPFHMEKVLSKSEIQKSKSSSKFTQKVIKNRKLLLKNKVSKIKSKLQHSKNNPVSPSNRFLQSDTLQYTDPNIYNHVDEFIYPTFNQDIAPVYFYDLVFENAIENLKYCDIVGYDSLGMSSNQVLYPHLMEQMFVFFEEIEKVQVGKFMNCWNKTYA